MKSIDDLVRIVSHGGGFTIDVSNKSTDDLVRIASHGKGSVVFDLEV